MRILFEEVRIPYLGKDLFNLKFEQQTTIVRGDSATGKTLLVALVNAYKNYKLEGNRLEVANLSRFITINWDTPREVIDEILKVTDRLIIVDSGDIVLGRNRYLVDFINEDINNQWLIFARGNVGLVTDRWQYAEFKRDGDTITLEYQERQ